jgi:hypothetical protein
VIRILTSKTIPTMDCTRTRGDQQRSAVIFVQHPGRCSSCRVSNRVCRESGDLLCFRSHRENLQQQRVIPVAGFHPGQKAMRYQCGKSLHSSGCRDSWRFCRQLQSGQQLLRGTNSLGQLTLPDRTNACAADCSRHGGFGRIWPLQRCRHVRPGSTGPIYRQTPRRCIRRILSIDLIGRHQDSLCLRLLLLCGPRMRLKRRNFRQQAGDSREQFTN